MSNRERSQCRYALLIHATHSTRRSTGRLRWGPYVVNLSSPNPNGYAVHAPGRLRRGNRDIIDDAHGISGTIEMRWKASRVSAPLQKRRRDGVDIDELLCVCRCRAHLRSERYNVPTASTARPAMHNAGTELRDHSSPWLLRTNKSPMAERQCAIASCAASKVSVVRMQMLLAHCVHPSALNN